MCEGHSYASSGNVSAISKRFTSSFPDTDQAGLAGHHTGIERVPRQLVSFLAVMLSCAFMALCAYGAFVADGAARGGASASLLNPRDIPAEVSEMRVPAEGGALIEQPMRVRLGAEGSYTPSPHFILAALGQRGRGHGGGASLRAISCSESSFTGAGTDACVVSLSARAGTGGFTVSLSSNNSAVSVPSSVTVAAGATSAAFTVTVAAVTTAQSATLTASAGGVSKTYAISLSPAVSDVPQLTLSASSLSFGSITVNTTSTQSVTLTSSGTAPLTISSGSMTGAGFSLSGVSFPMTLNPGQTATLTVSFDPTATGAITGSITLTDNASPSTATISLSGTGTSTQTGNTYSTSFPLTEKPISESGNWQVPSQSGDSSLWGDVQTTPGLAFGINEPTTYGDPTAVLTGTWGADQTVTATVKVNSVPTSCCHEVELRLRTTIASGSIRGYELNCPIFSNPSYGYQIVRWNGSNGQYVVIGGSGPHQCVNGDVLKGTVSGTNPTTINFYSNGVLVATACDNGGGSGGSCGGTSYTGPSGPAGPWTSGNPGMGFYDNYDNSWNAFGFSNYTATDGGSGASGSGSSGAGGSSVALGALSCNSAAMTGAGTDACTVTLTGAAPTGGQTVSLSSNNSAVTVPSSVTVAAGATSAGFAATVSAVTTAQTATLTASAGGIVKTYAISLSPAAVPVLTLGATSVSFGDVALNSPATQQVSLTSSGGAPLTISAGSVTGAGFSISGISYPLTLNPGQSAALYVEFDPTTGGAATGAVTLTSNASNGTTSSIGLSGTGQATNYAVDLSWNAPTSSPDPVAGYHVYRATGSSTSYQLVNNTVLTTTSYADTGVQNSTSYSYYIKSVDASGNESDPSNTITVNIP
jgi:Cep192 domain 4